MLRITRSFLSQRFANQLASVGHLGMLLLGLELGSGPGWVAILAVIASTSAILWGANYRRSRTVADTPTSRMRKAETVS